MGVQKRGSRRGSRFCLHPLHTTHPHKVILERLWPFLLFDLFNCRNMQMRKHNNIRFVDLRLCVWDCTKSISNNNKAVVLRQQGTWNVDLSLQQPVVFKLLFVWDLTLTFYLSLHLSHCKTSCGLQYWSAFQVDCILMYHTCRKVKWYWSGPWSLRVKELKKLVNCKN